MNDYTYKMRIRLKESNCDNITEIEMKDYRGREKNLTELVKFKSFLSQGTNGKTSITLEHKYDTKDITDELKFSIGKIKKYDLRCDIYENESDKSEGIDNKSGDYDKMLDDYEAYVDEYIVF